jgi:hypothetical protein
LGIPEPCEADDNFLVSEEKNELDDSFGFDGMYGSTLSASSGVFCAPAEALPLGAGGDLSGCDC